MGMLELHKIELAAAAWWERLNNAERKAYIDAHKRSKYAKDWMREEKTKTKKSSWMDWVRDEFKPTNAKGKKKAGTKTKESWLDWIKDEFTPRHEEKPKVEKEVKQVRRVRQIPIKPKITKPITPAKPAKFDYKDDVTTFVVGDIHGCFDKLQELFNQCNVYKKAHGIKHARAVFLGDYIDRGPDSAKVLERLIKGDKNSPFDEEIYLRGNHEQMMIDALNAPEDKGTVRQWLRNGGEETLQSFNRSIPAEHKDWLESLPHSFEDGRHFYVHAGVNPNSNIHKQQREEMLWIRDKFLNHPKKYEKYIVHGHTPTDSTGTKLRSDPDIKENRTNLDTGAVYGGKLTAGVFSNKQDKPLTTISV